MSQATEIESRIVAAGARLAAAGPWQQVLLRDVAADAGLPLADVFAVIPSTSDLVARILADGDRQMLHDYDPDPTDVSVRDRLFDAVMTRFEVCEPQRAALTSIWHAVRRDPLQMLALRRSLLRTADALVVAVWGDASGLAGLARTRAVAVLWLDCLQVWVDDQPGELAKTMAHLDQRLRLAEEWLPRCRPGGRSAAAEGLS